MGLKKSKTKIVITGAAGFIGKYLILNLKNDRKIKLILIDKKNKPKIKLFNKLKYIKFDLNKNIKKKLTYLDADIIVHLAALTSVTDSEKFKEKYFQTNYIVTKKISEYCKVNKKKLIFASSAGIYKSKNTAIKENDPKKPKNFYGKTKLMSEKYIIKHMKGMSNYIILRFFNVGGGDNINQIRFSKNNFPVFKIITNKIKNNRKFLIYGKDPKNNQTAIRDYIHALDIANIIKQSILHLIKNKKNLILNCSNEKPTTIEELIRVFAKISKKKINYQIVKKRVGEDFVFYGDNKKLNKTFNFKLKYNLKRIIKDSYESIY